MVIKNPVVIALAVIADITLLVLGYKPWRSASAGKLRTVMNGFHSWMLNRKRPIPDGDAGGKVDAENQRLTSAGCTEPLEVIMERSLGSQVRHVYPVNTIGQSLVILASAKQQTRKVLFDSGSALTLILDGLVKALGIAFSSFTCQPPVFVVGEMIDLLGEVELNLRVGEMEMFRLFRVLSGCCQDGIIEMYCIRKLGPVILNLKLMVRGVPVPLESSCVPPVKLVDVSIIRIPSRHVAIVKAKTAIRVKQGQPMIFEQDPEKYDLFMSTRILLESADAMPGEL